MNILLTGATGYIGKRLLPVLLNNGHKVYCCVRDKQRFSTENFNSDFLEVIQVDFLNKESLQNIPDDIDAAYYLIHSMSSSTTDFQKLEEQSAENFKERMNKTSVSQVVYLSGIVNDEKLSKHLKSRHSVENILSSGNYSLTTLKAGIIIGSGSASFEIIRDLVEKLPVMITPKWLLTKTQPIAIRNVIEFLTGVLLNRETYNQSYDIGGPDILNYKQMLLDFAEVRELKRKIFIVPVMTPNISSYWLYFITATSFRLAKNLVNSMKVEVVSKDNNLQELLNIKPISFKESIQMAFDKIEQNQVISSWKDALTTHTLDDGISKLIEVPQFGCFKDVKTKRLRNQESALDKIWSIGGSNGWYYADWLWELRGLMDQIFGGVGLRRGRKNAQRIEAGDTLDFWRVLYASRTEKRLLLYAEMKLPGEAWLEFRIDDGVLHQTATFRPLGLLGRLYWYAVLPFHYFVFNGLINKLAK